MIGEIVMKYKKEQNTLPKDILDLVQKYIDGDYIN